VPVIPFNKMVDKKIIIEKDGLREAQGSLTTKTIKQ
jgi:hypothetical protein